MNYVHSWIMRMYINGVKKYDKYENDIVKNIADVLIWAVVTTHRGISSNVELFSSPEKAEDRKRAIEISLNIEDDDVSIIPCSYMQTN